MVRRHRQGDTHRETQAQAGVAGGACYSNCSTIKSPLNVQYSPARVCRSDGNLLASVAPSPVCRPTHIVCIILAPELHEAIALVCVCDPILWKVHVDCSDACRGCISAGQVSFLRLVRPPCCNCCNLSACHGCVRSPTGPACVNSSQTISSATCIHTVTMNVL